MSLIDALRKFAARPRQEKEMFVEAFVLLGAMRAAMLLLPFRRISGIMGLVQCGPTAEPVSVATGDPAKIGWAIQAAAARTPWESACLVQALAGVVMLSQRGFRSTLYLGVARDESDILQVKAHAWLKCGAEIVSGASGHEKYAVISSFNKG